MQCIYRGDTLLDARMVADQLIQQDIPAEIFGGHLPGGAGELPAGGMVRVMVADEDRERALRIVAEWERTTTRQAHEHLSASSRARSLAAFLLGLTTGIAGVWVFIALPGPAEQTRYFDHNGDHRPDTWYHYNRGQLERIRKDRNFDGEADALWQYGPESSRGEARLDQDFDGRRETRLIFENDLPHSREIDLDGNGVTDISERYRDGVLHERRYHHPDSGRVVKRTRYRAGVLPLEAELDTTGDGITETLIRFDRYGEPR